MIQSSNLPGFCFPWLHAVHPIQHMNITIIMVMKEICKVCKPCLDQLSETIQMMYFAFGLTNVWPTSKKST